MLFLNIACQPSEQLLDTEDVVVAKVGDRVLNLSTVRQVIHAYNTPSDSLAMSTSYINQWIRNQLMMREAARYFSTDEAIEQLVTDFRQRLLMHSLENKIIEERFDTLIAESELMDFYDQMKSQFILREPLFRGMYVKFPNETKSLDQFYKDWKQEEVHAIITFASAYGEALEIDTSIWRTWDEIKGWYPKFSLNTALREKSQRRLDTKAQYYLKIAQKVDKGQYSPLTYIEPQLKRMLLYNRRKALLEKYKEELYEKALQENIIKL